MAASAPGPVPNEGLAANVEAVRAVPPSRKLANVLVFLLRDIAFDIVINAGCHQGEGLESWRRLSAEFDTRVATRFSGMLLKLMTWNFTGDTISRLEGWERACSDVKAAMHRTRFDITYVVLCPGA